jgi:perosamine synthetase
LRALCNSAGELERLEEELSDYFGTPHVFLLSSGKAALTILLRSLATMRPERRQVVVPAYTCYSVPSAVLKAGLDIVPCDLEPGTTGFDLGQLREKISDRTLCVISTHLFGIPEDMDTVRSLARGKGCFVVEDTAQAMGGLYRGELLGTLGDAGIFSLDRGKNITCGGGGIIATRDNVIAAAVREEYVRLPRPSFGEDMAGLAVMACLSVFLRPFLYWFPAGLPFLRLGETVFHRDFPVKRLSPAKAGTLRGWQARLERHNATRAANAAFAAKAAGSGGDGLTVLEAGNRTALLRLPVLAADEATRDAVVSSPRNRRLGFSVMYPLPVHQIAEIRDRFAGREYPAARDTAARLFTVPVHPLLSKNDRDRLAHALERLGKRAAGATSGGDGAGRRCSTAETIGGGYA